MRALVTGAPGFIGSHLTARLESQGYDAVRRDVGARLVSASSSSVYGDQQVCPLAASMRPLPRSPYAASKLAGEAYCRALAVSMGYRP